MAARIGTASLVNVGLEHDFLCFDKKLIVLGSVDL